MRSELAWRPSAIVTRAHTDVSSILPPTCEKIMAITSITIENFKCIGDAVTIPIRPITLLFGKNSSGKSTVLQAASYGFEVFLRMLSNESLYRLNKVNIIRGGGHTIRGDFSSLVHCYDLKRKICIRIEFSINKTTKFKMDSGWIEVIIGRNTKINASGVLGLNGTKFMRFESKKITMGDKEKWAKLSEDCLLYWNTQHPFTQYLKSLKSDEAKKSIDSFSAYINYLCCYGFLYLGPIRSTPFDMSKSKNKKKNKDKRISNKKNKTTDSKEKLEAYIVRILQENKVNREDFAKHSASGLIHYGFLMVGGEKSIKRINDYMRDIFKLGYTISDIDRMRFHDEDRNIDVGLADIGTGVGQVIPVVVGALYQDPAMDKLPKLFAVEQPELHIHPALQVNLGDLFIDGIHNSNRTTLIETHSEHLLLRLLRRVRETTRRSRPQATEAEQTDHELTPNDLSVVYVRPTPAGVKFTPLTVTNKGDFDAPWPEGFFEERESEWY